MLILSGVFASPWLVKVLLGKGHKSQSGNPTFAIINSISLMYLKILKVTNVSLEKVAFKVKTTQPSWYYVRPNQQIVDVNKTEEVIISMLESECKYGQIFLINLLSA